MSVILYAPTGYVKEVHHQKELKLEALRGKKIGFIFNQHGSVLAFWKKLEQEVLSTLEPTAVCRIYKDNTWAPAATSEVDRMVAETDYALVGVGA